MQHGMVDLVIVGADRVTRTGDVANKIGTYLKALAARDNQILFYVDVAFPSSTFDWDLADGVKEIPIEERDPAEVRYVFGLCDNTDKQVLVCPQSTPARNCGFDITLSRLINGLLTERGLCTADQEDILSDADKDDDHLSSRRLMSKAFRRSTCSGVTQQGVSA